MHAIHVRAVPPGGGAHPARGRDTLVMNVCCAFNLQVAPIFQQPYALAVAKGDNPMYDRCA
jgi:hypothetical protein